MEGWRTTLTARLALAVTTALGAVPSGAQDTGAVTGPAMPVAAAAAQDAGAPAERSPRCARPADPRTTTFHCRSEPFDAARETLSGLATNVRDDLKRAGITPTASYAGAYFGATGGPGTAPTYAGQLTAALNVDLARLGAWSGSSFYVSGIWAQQTNDGSYLNTNLFAVNSLAAGSSAWLAEMYFQQTLANGNVTLAVGRLAPGATFATLPVLAHYLSTALAGNPGAPGANDPVFPAPPTNTQWAAQAVYKLTPEWQIAGGYFNNNPNAAAGAQRGLDFRWRQGNSGAFFIGQVSWLPNQSGTKGLPGEYTLGLYYDTNSFADLATGASVKNLWNAYLLGQQQVSGATDGTGLTLWGGVTVGSPQSVNILPLQVMAGASYQGLVAGRPNDIASFGWSYGRVSNTQPGATATQVAELNYQWVASGWLTLAADYQYLWHLNGLPTSSASVFGIQANVTF
jgi:porin